MKMKTKSESRIRIESNSENAQVIAEAADFHSRRMNRESKIKSKRKSANQPVGNYEYEQMVAEDADFNTGKLISEAAYFIAERRGFAPGSALSDWLQAEKEIEGLLRSAVGERRRGVTEDRRSGAHLKT
jgi:hypothetical protein